MTDPTTPNAPVPEPLSPAQAIVKAFDDRYELLGPLEDDWQEQCIAAALRAVADHVVPETEQPRNVIGYELGDWDARDAVRREIRAIATELEGHQ
jgi:hypothetical protein